ncbi:metallophosphoesterase [Bacillus mexicanus]|uniref:metallophosphoesterase family protein n=1 Tax=Bacillus mexicanus TaxID=2834415 RepID=UPI003D25B5E8
MSNKKIKFMHIADTHLGYNGNASLHNEFSELKVNKWTETGENIRTSDVNNSFAQAIDIALEEKVDFTIHAGDGINQVGYKNPAYYNFYMDQVERFSTTGRQWIEIAGNHNFSKKAGIGNELFKLGKMENVVTSYKGIYEIYEIPNSDIICHLLPSSYNNVSFKKELEKVKRIEGKFNILVAHCGVSTIPHYANNDSSIVVHIDDLINLKMDYIALGDYHFFTDLGNNIIYPGPIDHLAFGQEKNPRVLIVEVDLVTFEVEINHRFLRVRPMIDMKPIDAEGMLLEDIQSQILERFESAEIDDSIVRIVIKNLSKNLKHRHLFLTDKIKEYIDRCLYFKFEFKNKIDLSNTINFKSNDEEEFEGLQEGLKSFIDELPEDPNFLRNDLYAITSKYLTEVLENED